MSMQKPLCYLFYCRPTASKSGTMVLSYPMLEGQSRWERFPFNPSVVQAAWEATAWLQRNVSMYKYATGTRVVPVRVTRAALADIIQNLEAC